MARTQHAPLDVVELLVDSGRWPAGTIGTIVEADADKAVVEINDDRGHARVPAFLLKFTACH